MKFLFDQNISHRVLSKIPEKFSDSTSVKQEGLINAPDKIIWIRTGNMKTQGILDTLVEYSEDIERFIADENFGCFEIIKLKIQ